MCSIISGHHCIRLLTAEQARRPHGASGPHFRVSPPAANARHLRHPKRNAAPGGTDPHLAAREPAGVGRVPGGVRAARAEGAAEAALRAARDLEVLPHRRRQHPLLPAAVRGRRVLPCVRHEQRN